MSCPLWIVWIGATEHALLFFHAATNGTLYQFALALDADTKWLGTLIVGGTFWLLCFIFLHVLHNHGGFQWFVARLKHGLNAKQHGQTRKETRHNAHAD